MYLELLLSKMSYVEDVILVLEECMDAYSGTSNQKETKEELIWVILINHHDLNFLVITRLSANNEI